jgi:cob(I)alamin adenosyltransferase
LVDADILIELIRHKPEHTELVLTGRGIPGKVIALAKQDYVTEMNKKAHPYDRGINARRGIEF